MQMGRALLPRKVYMQRSKKILEIAAFTLEGALLAQESGADRIELCENPNDGGTTPSYGTLKQARKYLSIPVFPIIRPRGGNFVYTEMEFESMLYDCELCNDLGFEGVVTGMLDASGNIHVQQLQQFKQVAGSMQITFHRAFDRCANTSQALDEIIDCGCTRILTSGQFPSAVDGLHCLRELALLAKHRICIMPGSGVKSSNIELFLRDNLFDEFHTAARKSSEIGKIFTPNSMQENLTHTIVDSEEIKRLKKALDTYPN
jgi:copper homeostasis protein